MPLSEVISPVNVLLYAIDPIDSQDILYVLPLMSDYRKPNTHKITFRFTDVQSVKLFDIRAYPEFQKDGLGRQRDFDFR